MKVPNLRDLEFSEKDFKPVESTDMLSTIAREEPDMRDSNPDMNMSEYVADTPSFGPLGAQGRNG